MKTDRKIRAQCKLSTRSSLIRSPIMHDVSEALARPESWDFSHIPDINFEDTGYATLIMSTEKER